MMFTEILMEKRERIALITLNRPDVLNAFSIEMRKKLGLFFETMAKDDDIRAVVVTGAGRAFSAGGDIKTWEDLKDDNKLKQIMEYVHRNVTSIINIEKPVIAMVNGDAVGAGCNLALACDLVIASENARFGEVFVKMGLGSDWGGAYILPRLVGMAKAKELLFTGKIINAQEALKMGLINSVVPPEALEETVMKLAEKLSRSATKAMGMTKTFLNKAWQMDIREAMEYEAAMQKELLKSADHQEAVNAFFSKSKPVFTGK